MSVAITAEFTSPTDIVLKQKGTVDENGLKAAGVGWLKRKSLKMALKMAPEAEKEVLETSKRLLVEEMTFILNRTK